MFIEVTLEEEAVQGSNVVNFSHYIARMGTKTRTASLWNHPMAGFAGCDVINLSDRRRRHS